MCGESLFFSNHLAEEERAGRFTLIMLWLTVLVSLFLTVS